MKRQREADRHAMSTKGRRSLQQRLRPICLSYRHNESAAMTGRHDWLVNYFGEKRVFMGIDIPSGVDFASHIDGQIEQTVVLLAIIGSKWLGADPAGGNRIDDGKDLVRAEI